MSALALKRAPAGAAAEFLAFVADGPTREAVQAVTQKHWPGAEVKLGNVADAARAVRDLGAPKLLIVDVSGCAEIAEAILSLSQSCDAGTVVIAIGDRNDITLYRELVGLGVADYLLKPVTGEALRKAIIGATRTHDEQPSEAGKGRLAAVIGVHGGVGATMVATNLAWLIAEELRQRTALVDLDLQFGAAALALDLEPGRGLSEALTNPDRIDSLFVSSALVQRTERLFLLAAEEPLGNRLSVHGERGPEILFEQLKRSFECVVADLPRGLVVAEPAVLSEFADITMVSDLSLGGIRDSLRLVNFVKESAPRATLRVLLNHARPKVEPGPGIADFAKAVGLQPAAELPHEPKPMAAALAGGKPVVAAGRGQAAKHLTAIAGIVGGAAKPKAEPFWKKYLKRGK